MQQRERVAVARSSGHIAQYTPAEAQPARPSTGPETREIADSGPTRSAPSNHETLTELSRSREHAGALRTPIACSRDSRAGRAHGSGAAPTKRRHRNRLPGTSRKLW
jgi:hypothetical protein